LQVQCLSVAGHLKCETQDQWVSGVPQILFHYVLNLTDEQHFNQFGSAG